MKRRLAVLVQAIALILFGSVLTASPASANASFGWTFSGDYGIFSREFTQANEKNIYVKVSSWSPCRVNGDNVTIYLYLYKQNFLGETQVGSMKQLDCVGTVKWSLVNPGTYRWRLLIEGQHRDQVGLSFYATGRTYYYGSAP